MTILRVKIPSMQKVYILIGLPGSGKTTFARKLISNDPYNTIRIAMDDILQMTSFYNFIRENVPLYHEFESTMYVTAITQGFNVIVDRTNIDRKTREMFIKPPRRTREIARMILDSLNQERMSLFRESDEKIIEKILKEFKKDDELTEKIIQSFWKMFVSSLNPDLYHNRQDFESILKTVSNLEIVGVFFDLPIDVCIKRRTQDPYVLIRGEGIDWEGVIKKLAEKFETPEIDEGFDRLDVLSR